MEFNYWDKFLTKKIITATSFGGSGAGAISDLFKEFHLGHSFGNKELWFLQDYDGISDLDYYLNDGNHRSKVSYAIKNFEKYIENNMIFYKEIFGDNFKKITTDFIDSLKDASFNKSISKHEISNIFLRHLIFKLSPFMQYLYSRLIKGKIIEFIPYLPRRRKYYSHPDSDRFYKYVQEYTSRLFDEIDSKAEFEFLYFEQLVPSIKIDRYFNYINNMKVIIVDRDPRDIYLMNQMRWKGAAFICDTTNIDEYITWYRSMRFNLKKDIENPNTIKINFEELVYNYETTLSTILNFVDISSELHINKKKFFDPDVSIHNTKLWKGNHNYKNEITKIEELLFEYCYQ